MFNSGHYPLFVAPPGGSGSCSHGVERRAASPETRNSVGRNRFAKAGPRGGEENVHPLGRQTWFRPAPKPTHKLIRRESIAGEHAAFMPPLTNATRLGGPPFGPCFNHQRRRRPRCASGKHSNTFLSKKHPTPPAPPPPTAPSPPALGPRFSIRLVKKFFFHRRPAAKRLALFCVWGPRRGAGKNSSRPLVTPSTG